MLTIYYFTSIETAVSRETSILVNNYLLITALGKARTDLLSELSRAVLDCGCNIVDSRISVLAGECSATLLLQGTWNTLAKLEAQLKKLEQSLDVIMLSKRCNAVRNPDNALPYSVEVIALDKPGIVHRLTQFFGSRSVHIEELVSRRYTAPHTTTSMAAINMIIGVPGKIHIALLRDEFMDLCDELNWDAVIEPIKG